MTKKQKRFVEEYLIDLNAAKAAIRAGYSPKAAKQIGQRLLTYADLRAAIDKAIAERSRRVGIEQDRVLRELAKIAFLDAAAVIDTETVEIKADASREDTACIAGVKTRTLPTAAGLIVEREVRFYDKLKALELLGKHLGLFTDKVNLGVAVPVVIYGDIPPDE